MRTLFVVVVTCAAACAQATTNGAGAGVMSEWDVTAMLAKLQTQTKQLGPAIDQMRPDMWAVNGAPATYAQQLRTAKNEVQYLTGAAQALTQQPERLTLALDTLFRMQALDRTFESLIAATRKYQNATLADKLQARLGENSVSRDKLRQYVVELAKQKEHEYQVMDGEAQRCRATLAGARSGTTQRRKTAPQASEQK